MLELDRSLTQAVSVENYEIRNFRYDYRHILEYLYRVSFLTTLDIYKNYFKSYHKWCKVLQKNNPCILWPETEITLYHHILYRSYCIFTPRVLWPRSFLIFIVDELKNFATNNLFKLLELVTYWDPCTLVSHELGFVHQGKDCRYNTSPIGYWDKSSIIGWYFGIGQRVW